MFSGARRPGIFLTTHLGVIVLAIISLVLFFWLKDCRSRRITPRHLEDDEMHLQPKGTSFDRVSAEEKDDDTITLSEPVCSFLFIYGTMLD